MPKRASRKRRKIDSFTSADVSVPSISHPPLSHAPFSIKASESELVQMDSKGFEDYVSETRRHRPLSRDEEELAKKMLKKIKNRESARKSRQAKKEHTVGLSEQVDELTNQVQALKIEAATLTAANYQIKQEISFTEALILANPVLAKLYADKCQQQQNRFNPKISNIPATNSPLNMISVGAH